ncbi:hypothetical protein DH2020_010470 [Rehmannia glutinosa]|uniref:ubiquitinyl hydrolase 1 n=1 Tax=Rehmannia glutinosa TaxID=99300 RepID=A0ABR0XAR4_REHGL
MHENCHVHAEDEEMLVPHADFAAEGPQPMEVAPAEATSTVGTPAVDEPPSARFTWTIENFTKLNVKKQYSEVFHVGGYKWRVLMFPKGNNVDYLSMYLDVADSTTLPYGWSRYAQFSLSVVNQIHSKYTLVLMFLLALFVVFVRRASCLSVTGVIIMTIPQYLAVRITSHEAKILFVFFEISLWVLGLGVFTQHSRLDDGFDKTNSADTQHQFNSRESDWGFTSFMPLSELYDLGRGYLVNDTCIVEADVAVRRVVDYWLYTTCRQQKMIIHLEASLWLCRVYFYKLQYSDTSVATKELTKSFGWDTYDSFMQHDVQELNRVLCEKLEDKMKGTVVEGTIQQLFEGHHMNYIACINVDYKSTRKESFYDLQLDVKGCKDIYASFDKYVEVERLEGDNKYHAEHYGLQDARKGVLFIDFPPVLQLQLKRFEYDFVRDTMVKFQNCSLPVILDYCLPSLAISIHVDGPMYDLELISVLVGSFSSLNSVSEINDRYEFPLQLDLDRENGKYLSPDADRSVRNLYTLHSVLVHSGGVHGGHYYAYIRPTLSDQWFKFDDERVTKEDMKRALEEQYGGEEELPQTNPGFNNSPFKFTKYSNAYMLVYIRESDKEKIICNVDEKDIAEHLRIRLKKEQEEKEQKRKEKAEAHLYTIIKVARDIDLIDQIGREIYFDLVDHDKVRSFRIQKQLSFNTFKEEVAKELEIPVQCQRFWLWAKRQNHTYRPNRPLTPQEEAQSVYPLSRSDDDWNSSFGKACSSNLDNHVVDDESFKLQRVKEIDYGRKGTYAQEYISLVSPLDVICVGQLREVSNKANNAELKLFLEVAFDLDMRPILPPEKTKEDILLFFKLYDPIKEELGYVGRLFVKGNAKPMEIFKQLNKMAGFAPDEEIELFEEIKFEPNVMCDRIDKKLSFRGSQLEDGDIICFQKSPQGQNSEECRYPTVPAFLEYVHNRQVCGVIDLYGGVGLELRSKLNNYDEVVENVARHLDLDDSSKIRLTSHNCYSQQPKPQPIKYRGAERLTDMLVHYNQISDILYYEVLDIPLPELQGLKTLKVAFHHATKDEVVIHTIRLPKQSTVGDVISDLKTKVELSHPDAELRLLEVFYYKIYKIFPLQEKIENINDQYWTLRAEEMRANGLVRLVLVSMDVGNQSVVEVIPEEERNLSPQARLIHVYHFMKDTTQNQVWKFAFLYMGRPEYLQDSDIVSCRFQRRDVYGAWEQYLGLEHSDNTPKRIGSHLRNLLKSTISTYPRKPPCIGCATPDVYFSEDSSSNMKQQQKLS